MNVRDLMPWSRNNRTQSPTLFAMRTALRRVSHLDRSLRAFGSLSSFGEGWPSVEISDAEQEVKVMAEVPGLEEKDIEVLLNDGGGI